MEIIINLLPTIIAILLVAGFLQYLGWLDTIIEKVADTAIWFFRWLFDVSGSIALLPEKLAYRDFVEKLDIVETKKGWFWTGVEITPIPSDGLSNQERNRLGELFNNFYTTLPARTRVQVVSIVDNNPSLATRVFNRLVKENKTNLLAPILLSRRNFLLKKAQSGDVRRVSTYVFFGRQASQIVVKKGFWRSVVSYIQSIYRPEVFLEIERSELGRVRAELLAIRDGFSTNFKVPWGQLEGVVRPLKPSEIFKLAWRKLNPELAKNHLPPIYDEEIFFPSIGDVVSANNANCSSNGNNKNGSNTQTNDGNKSNSINKLKDKPLTVYKRPFLDNPRELLCQTYVKHQDDYFLYGDTYVMTLSVTTFPTAVYPTMIEWLSRSRELSFPVEIATHFFTEDRADTLDFLAKKQKSARNALRRAGGNPDEVQEVQAEQYADLIRVITNENQVAGKLGFAVTFWASSRIELYRRRDQIINLVRQMQGTIVSPERHCAFDLHLTTMPCTPHGAADAPYGDFRERRALSREAAAMSPWTGAPTAIPRGVLPEKSTTVWQLRTKELFNWDSDPRNGIFRNGMSLIVGQAGSGKSAFLNSLRINHLLTRSGVTIDYNSSAIRLAKAVGGTVVDITKPGETKGLGLFAIKVQPREIFEKNELNEHGLPIDRITAVKEMLAVFCMDNPLAENPTPLPARMIAVLSTAVDLTYARLVRMNPTIDDFIFTLRTIPGEQRPLALDLADRLELFAKNSQLGYWLNDRSDPLPINNYVVFEFAGAKKNPRLRLVAAMALVQYVDRFIHYNPYTPKFLDVDELGEIAKERILAEVIDQLIRTARKKQTVVTVASQDARDFDTSDKLRAIQSSCEIKYIFETQKPEQTAESLDLNPGQYKAISSLRPATKEYSEFLLKYRSPQPGEGSALIRLSYSALEARLVAGAGNEIVTYEAALADAKATGLSIDSKLLAAIEMPALVGRGVSLKQQNTNQLIQQQNVNPLAQQQTGNQLQQIAG